MPFSLLTEFDIYLFKAGKHYRIYNKLGSHIVEHEGVKGVYFAVWAPSARKLSVLGGFNQWKHTDHSMLNRNDDSGIWELFVPNIGEGELYKYNITSYNGRVLEKTDPYAYRWEIPPATASIVWNLDYKWNDAQWLDKRAKNIGKSQPMTVYEVHLGSWRRNPLEDYRSLTYRELAVELVAYIQEMEFTHVEFLPVMEHPYSPSWGYQTLGYFAPTSRFGSPQDYMYLVDALHNAGIGILLDWVPSHFPEDAHGIADFDGTHLYEHADPRKGFHPDWKSCIYNFERGEVRSFLISNALFWIDTYHADGIRVDAVASMLYLDYSRKEGEWIPNIFGGKENLEAISFLKELNETIYTNFPDVVTIAEESTSWPGVSRPTFEGGLGFGQKWMMGWMHDTLSFFKREPHYRSWHQNEITFSIVYAFAENFMLPLSHDEVVHGKASLIGKMPGGEAQKFANLRTMYAYMFTHPGTRLLFMGCEFAQYSEWNSEGSLDWHLLQFPLHKGIQALIKDLNIINKNYPAIYSNAFDGNGFEWISYDDNQNSVIAYLRKGNTKDKPILVVCNMQENGFDDYMLGVPIAGDWKEILNTNDLKYAGTGTQHNNTITTVPIINHDKKQSIGVKMAPLSVVILEYVGKSKKEIIKSAAKTRSK
jgi:1,4-alpha-glucan branching enzyme